MTMQRAYRWPFIACLTAFLVLVALAPARAQNNGKQQGGDLSSGAFTFTILDPPNSILTEVVGINAAGHVVGQYFDSSGVHAFLAR